MIRLDSERMDHRFRLAVDVVVAMVAAVLLVEGEIFDDGM